MGTWGFGNFDDDTASDHLSMIAGRLIKEISEAMKQPKKLEPDEYLGVAVPCNVELLALFAEKGWVGALTPEAETIAEWKKLYLAVWDGYMDKLKPKPEYKKKRRAVLVKTFDRLMRVAKGP